MPCKEKGKLRAPYKVIGGVPMCGGCVADHEEEARRKIPPLETKLTPALPAEPEPAKPDHGKIEEKEGTKMSKKIDQETIDKIRKMAAEGKKINAIATELNVSWLTVRNYAAGTNGSGNHAAPAGKKAGKRGPRLAVRVVSPGGRFSATIAQLREERDRIDRVLAELEKM